MDPERFARLSAAFGRALELPPEARVAELERALADEPALLGEALAMLRAHERADAFLEPPGEATLAGLGRTRVDYADLRPGARVGEFVLVERLGSGGMGEVWRARQERPERDVALKTLRAGLATERARRRFEDEAELLGRLSHPAIAKVLAAGTLADEAGADGAGTDDGRPAGGSRAPRPWFALELVEDARPLDRVARELDLGARIALLRTVAEAVHHGHLRGVVHRDLKPDNVLVDRDGRPRIIDFGIARATGAVDLPSLTLGGEVLGTLRYMAPEQVRGDQAGIDARADVHALGVLLYELVTSRSPWGAEGDGAGWTALAQEVVEREPAPPSRVAPGLSRELDWIVLCALAKEPERRYASAQEFADELGRFLAQEPLLAGPPSLGYRARKFARRNRAAVLGSGLALALLVLGAAGTGYGLLQALDRGRALEQRGQELVAARDAAERARGEAEAARGEAERRLDRALAINEFLDLMLRGTNPFATPGVGLGAESTVAEMLDRAAERVGEAFPGRPDLEAHTRILIGVGYDGQGRYAEAEGHLAEAVRLLAGIEPVGETDPFLAARRLAVTRLRLGREPEAQLALLRATREAARAALTDDYPELGALDSDLAWMLQELGRVEESLPFATAALEHFESLGPEFAPAAASVSSLLARAERTAGDPERIEAAYRRSLALLEGAYGDASLAAASGRSNLGLWLLEVGRLDEARAELERSIAVTRGAVGGDHPQEAVAQYNLAYLLSLQGEREAAVAVSEDCLALNRRLYGELHRETADAHVGLALALYDLGRFVEAAEHFADAERARAELLGAEHRKTLEARARTFDARLRAGDPEQRAGALEGLEALWGAVVAGHGPEGSLTRWLAGLGRRATESIGGADAERWRARAGTR